MPMQFQCKSSRPVHQPACRQVQQLQPPSPCRWDICTSARTWATSLADTGPLFTPPVPVEAAVFSEETALYEFGEYGWGGGKHSKSTEEAAGQLVRVGCSEVVSRGRSRIATEHWGHCAWLGPMPPISRVNTRAVHTPTAISRSTPTAFSWSNPARPTLPPSCLRADKFLFKVNQLGGYNGLPVSCAEET